MAQTGAVNHYPRHIGDYAKDTRHLTLVQHGAYTLLLDHIYATEKPLPADRKQLYAICGAKLKFERTAVDYVADTFFPQGTNKRATEELSKYQEKSRKAQASAQLSVESRRSATAQRTLSTRSASVELTKNQEPRTSNHGDGVDVSGLSKAVELPVDKKIEKTPEALRSLQNPAWLFSFDHAKLHARKLGIHVAGKTHQELKDAIAERLKLPAPSDQLTKFAQSQ